MHIANGYKPGAMHALHCRTCNRDTPHRGGTCLYCGNIRVSKKARLADIARVKLMAAFAERGAGGIFKTHRDWQNESMRKQRLVKAARREAFVRRAEESRKKFESQPVATGKP